MKNVITEIIILENDNKSSILTIFIWNEHYKNDDKNTLFVTMNKQFRFEILTTKIRLQNLISIYMMFALFISLSHLLLTITDKTNRRQLRKKIASLFREQIAIYTILNLKKRMSTTNAKKLSQRIWTQILNLNINDVEIKNNFFRLDNDFITAIKLIITTRQNELNLFVEKMFIQLKFRDFAIVCKNINYKKTSIIWWSNDSF